MLSAVMSLTALGLSLGFLLGYAAKFFKVEAAPIVEEIEMMMPGSQCGQCGYPGCRPAAEAIAGRQSVGRTIGGKIECCD